MKFRLLVAAAILVAGSIVSTETFAQYAPGSNGNLTNNLFQQYYTPAGASQVTAGLYPAPHWVPANGGHTYYTYQALMPHEMMYQHSRNYYNYQAGPEAYYQDMCQCGGGGSLNITKVRWQSGANHMGSLPFTMDPLAKLQYSRASRRYGLSNGSNSLLNRGGCATGGCATGECGSGH